MDRRFANVHPELQAAARKAPSFTFSRNMLWLLRFAMLFMRAPKAPADISIENVLIPGRDTRRKLRLRFYRPKSVACPMPVLLWIHGGGHVIGKPEIDDRICAAFAREAKIYVVSIDYRLSPRHPYPAALDDCSAGLAWLQTNAATLGVDATRIAIGGASAGGCVAASLVQRVHDEQKIRPLLQLLVYPMLDDRTALHAASEDETHIAWNRTSNRFGWRSYLGKDPGAPNMPPYAVPARRADLSGLPPAWIGVGSEDLFYEEDAAYAERLGAAGVACQLDIVAGAFHGFDIFAPAAPVVQTFRSVQIAALKKYLFPLGS